LREADNPESLNESTRKDSDGPKPVDDMGSFSVPSVAELSGLSARERRARRATLDQEDEAAAAALRERRARREALKNEGTPERKGSVGRNDEYYNC
jgi:hypothetical protein